MDSKLSCVACCVAFAMVGGDAFTADLLIRTALDSRAWINPIPIANTQVGLGIVGQRIDYYETVPGIPRFSSESGWLPGLQFGLSAMGAVGPTDNVYLMSTFAWLRGYTDYGASGGPVTAAHSGADIRTLDIRIGKGFDVVTADWMVTPYLGTGYRGWDRSLTNKFGPWGYDEFYEHFYVGGGLLLQWAVTSRLVLSAAGLAGTTLAPKMTTSYNGGYPTKTLTYQLGSSSLYMAGLSADYAVTQDWHANIGIDFLSFRYGASPTAFDGTLEPDSQTSNWTFKAGVGYIFNKSAGAAAKP